MGGVASRNPTLTKNIDNTLNVRTKENGTGTYWQHVGRWLNGLMSVGVLSELTHSHITC